MSACVISMFVKALAGWLKMAGNTNTDMMADGFYRNKPGQLAGWLVGPLPSKLIPQ